MSPKVSAMMELLGEAKGIGGKLSLLKAIALGDLRRKHYQDCPKLVEVPFHRFDLCFQIAQGELTPYLEIREVIQRIGPSKEELSTWTILDCGANIGMFALFLKGAKRIIAIEPNPHCTARIRRNFQLNNITGEVVEAAITEQSGTVRMSFDRKASILSKISDQGETEVSAMSLDDVIESRNLDTVDLLKLDLEGHEMPALRGLRRSLEQKKVRRLFTECYGDEKRGQIDEFLKEYCLIRTTEFDYNFLYQLKLS